MKHSLHCNPYSGRSLSFGSLIGNPCGEGEREQLRRLLLRNPCGEGEREPLRRLWTNSSKMYTNTSYCRVAELFIISRWAERKTSFSSGLFGAIAHFGTHWACSDITVSHSNQEVLPVSTVNLSKFNVKCVSTVKSRNVVKLWELLLVSFRIYEEMVITNK